MFLSYVRTVCCVENFMGFQTREKIPKHGANGVILVRISGIYISERRQL
jgi:hypothetical protein